MSWFAVAAARMRGLWNRPRLDRELDDEIRFHLDMQAADNHRAGMSPDDARAAALRDFGGLVQTKETYRERRSIALLENAVRDARYGLRSLRNSPGFTLSAVTVLALAIGANTAMFSVVNAVLLRPLPYPAPEQLTMLWTEEPTQSLREGRSSLRDIEHWRSQREVFEDIASFDSVGTLLTGPDGVEPLVGGSASHNLFSVLGVQPILGRTVTAEESVQLQPLVLISHAFWQSRFSGSASALGAELVIDARPHRIVGVLPSGFQAGRLNADVWSAHPGKTTGNASQTWFAVGRLRPSLSLAQAQQRMTAVAQRLNADRPVSEGKRGITIIPIHEYLVGPQSRVALWMLAGAVFCVFLIAAANVTSLSLARGVSRAREIGVRLALGASGGRLLRQLATEGLLLATLAGSLGTGLAWAGVRLIRLYGPADLQRLDEVALDVQVLACALAITLLAGLLVGLAPAIPTLRHTSLAAGGRTTSGGTAAGRIRRALVIADFALAVVLLAGAGLLLRSWSYVNRIDSGFTLERVLLLELSAPPAVTAPVQRAAIYTRALEAVRAVAGVENAGIMGDFFISNPREHTLTVERAEDTVTARHRFAAAEISPGFFETMGTPLLRGRSLTPADGPGSPLVAMVNQSMAQRFWPGQSPIGRRFRFGAAGEQGAWYTVSGVVADLRRQGPERESFPQAFLPLAQTPPPHSIDIFVRTSAANPGAIAGSLQAALREVEKNAPIYGVTPLEQPIAAYLAQRRLQTGLLAGFSVVALLMAAVGIYGIIQYSISTRALEFGIRLAVGAQAGEIFRMVLSEGLKLSAAGLAIGLLGALWLSEASASLLAGVKPTDPLTFAGVSLLLLAVAGAACFFPARRAMKIEPVTALRQ